MSAADIRAKCPTCGRVHGVKPVGDGFTMKQHTRSDGYYLRSRCSGGAVATAEVLTWAKAERADAAAAAERGAIEREKARVDLVAALAAIDARETAARERVAAYDRAIARLAAKAT